jgi:hypothetical protein
VDDNFNLQWTGSTPNLNSLLQDLAEKYYNGKMDYDPLSRKSLCDQIAEIINITKIALNTVPIDSGKFSVGFSFKVDENIYTNEQTEIILIDNNYFNNQEDYFKVLESLSEKCIDVIWALRYSSLPIEDIAGILWENIDENIDLQGIGLMFLLNYDEENRDIELLNEFVDETVTEVQSGTDYFYFVYLEIEELIGNTNSNGNDNEKISGYISELDINGQNERYTDIFITYDQKPMSIWVISSVK